MILLLLACGPSGLVLAQDTADTALASDTADSGDSGEVIPGDSTDTGDSADTADSGDTGPPPWEPPTPDVVVDCKGGADFTTITAAIAAEPSGTHIGLRPCTYAETLDFSGKSLDIFGIDGPETTIVEGNGRGVVVTVADGESVGTRLAGVTITGGGGGGYASAVYVDGALFRLEKVVIADNERAYSVFWGEGSFLELVDVSFHDNKVSGGGYGAITVDNGSLVAERLGLDCDGADVALYEHNSSLVRDSSITCSGGSGIYVQGGELHLRGSRVDVSNVGVYGEDNDDTRNERMWLFNSALIGSTGVQASYMHVKADHDVFYGSRVGLELSRPHLESYVTNSVGVGSTCGIRTDGASDLFGWNALENNGNSCARDAFSTVSAPPAFVDAPDDLRPLKTSPLIDAGDPDKDAEDRDGSRSDIGVYGGAEGW